MAVDSAPLTYDFPPLTPEQWRARLQRELPAGLTLDSLRWHPPGEDYTLEPFYTAADVAPLPYPAAAPALPRAHQPAGGNRWRSVLTLAADEANGGHLTSDRARHALRDGFDGVELGLPDPAGFDLLPLLSVLGSAGADPATTLATVGFQLPASADGASFLKRLGAVAPTARGYLHVPTADFALPAADALQALAAARPGYSFAPLTLDGAALADAGAGHTLQLALLVSQAAAALDALTDGSIAPAQAGEYLRLTWGLSTSFFHDLAALRALRLLWFNLLAGYEVAPAEVITPTIHCRPSTRIVYAADPHTNLLRLTTAAMAAVLGGTDLLTLPAFDAPAPGGATALGERQARNLSLLLRHEARLAEVADPAAGSYYVEALTDQLARAAWTQFQELEAAGGYRAAQAGGRVAGLLAAQAHVFAEREASGQQVRIGVNKYQVRSER